MKRTVTFILTISFFLLGVTLNAQQRDCGTVSFDSLRRSLNPSYPSIDAFEEWLSKHIKSDSRNGRIKTTAYEVIYRIPVVVHVVHNGEPVGDGANISYEQVKSQIEVLNEDFRRTEGSNGFNDDANGTDTEIEFYLAETDPMGIAMSEPGVDRINGGRSEWPKGPFQNPIETSLKPSTIWDPTRYFNVWTVNFGGFFGRNLLGYAQFPDMSGLEGLEDVGGSAETDGVVIGYPYFGSSQKGDYDLYAPFDLGRTATHEVGHWLGLRHIWGDNDDCSLDDYCSDTPLAATANYGCPVGIVSCSSEDMIRNYMDYTDDACMNIFTFGQKERMRTVLENSPRRSEMITIVTGLPTETAVVNELLIHRESNNLVLSLSAGNDIASCRIIDSTGLSVHESSEQPIGVSYTVDISNLSSGLYIAIVSSSGNQRYIERIALE